MLTPNKSELLQLAKKYNTIPIQREFYADVVTPISILRRIAQSNQRYFLLESIEGGEKWGRYSFLGFNPTARIICKENQVTIEENETDVTSNGDPIEILRSFMKKYNSPKLQDFPPFTGGLVGYFSYSMIKYAEPILKLASGNFNDCEFMLFSKIIAYDHLKQKISIIVNISTDNLLENYEKAIVEIESLKNLIFENTPLKKLKTKSRPQFKSNMTKDEYCEIVEKTKRFIKDGDIFQAVISRRFETEYSDSLLNAYRILRTTNTSPYMVFIKCDDTEIISASPETLVKLQGKTLTTFPIVGSRPRGKTADEDMALEAELLADEKELAEHNMLVDLGRNDIGRIAKLTSVSVSKYLTVLKYSKIMHICSEVTGEIKDGLDAFDAVKSVLPAGTLSGAPKIRACEIIEQLEKSPRGIYGGAIGYIDFTGNIDTCIAIRMAVKKDDMVTVQAGAGIVAESVPESEYDESGNKAMAIINAVKNAAEVDD